MTKHGQRDLQPLKRRMCCCSVPSTGIHSLSAKRDQTTFTTTIQGSALHNLVNDVDGVNLRNLSLLSKWKHQHGDLLLTNASQMAFKRRYVISELRNYFGSQTVLNVSEKEMSLILKQEIDLQ